MTPTVEQCLNTVLAKLEAAPQKVRLVAVSKMQPTSSILNAYAAGQRLFGENRVQEALQKQSVCPKDIEWHLVGPLQSNKVKFCPQLFDTIHSLDRLDIAESLNHHCIKQQKKLKVLIQMNLTKEPTKSGLQTENELKILAEKVLELKQLKLVGLMTIPDPKFSQTAVKAVYQNLYQLNQKIAQALNIEPQMTELSMGMSMDYELAIEAGATLVRVGSQIFGMRPNLTTKKDIKEK